MSPAPQLNERYQILRELGEGGMGKVYLAHDTTLGRQVAIKTIRAPQSMTADEQRSMRDRFLHEARIVARMAHPGIVTIHDLFEYQGALFIVMEYVEGRSLADVLSENTPPSQSQREFFLRVLRETASALDYAHASQVVHRDVKPANLLIDRTGAIKITDFGIAKLTGGTTLTLTGMVVGTIDYMAPEQIKGDPIDGRADQFSLAVLAFRLLTGRKLFEADSFVALTYKICHDTPMPASTYNRDLPREVDVVLASALAKSPADRFRTCGEFVSALSGALAAVNRVKTVVEPVTTPAPRQMPAYARMTVEPPPPTSPWQPPSTPPVQQRHSKAPLIAGLAIVLLAGGGAALWLTRGAKTGEKPQSTAAHESATPGGTTPESAELSITTKRVSADYFRENRVPLLRGRSFTGNDRDVAIVNESLARKQWPQSDPIGRKIDSIAGLSPIIVGVAGDNQPGLVCYLPQETSASAPQARPPEVKPPTPQRIRVDSAVQEAKLIRKVSPEYPESAKLSRVEGTVLLTVIIDKGGSVKEVRPIGGPSLLIEPASDAVKQWQYRPTLVNGEPVEVITEVDVRFTLPLLVAASPPRKVESKGPVGGVTSIPSSIPPPPPPPRKTEGKSEGPQRIRVGGTVQAANLIRKVQPVYPQLAKQARVQGSVHFTAIIGTDGAIQNLQLISGHPLLVQAAQDAVKQWLYKPTLMNGEPVEVVTQIDVNFTLSQTGRAKY